jgi:tetratricopeptide (TPR) repeat protein
MVQDRSEEAFMTNATRLRAALVLVLALAAGAAGRLAAQGGQTMAPESKDIVAASQLKDPAARLREFERIRAAYPGSRYMEAIEANILDAKVILSGSLDEIAGLQRDFLAKTAGPSRLQAPVAMAVQLLNHPRLESFDHTRVLDIALAYRGAVIRGVEDPAAYQGIPQDQHEFFKSYVLSAIELLTARAYLNAGDMDKAMASVEAYKKAGGATGGNYHYVLAGILLGQGRTEEAADHYLAAAADNYGDAAAKARSLYARLNGSEAGFEAALAAKLKALPFEPEPFKAPAALRGKTVLAELFTGSECPPCVGADIAFDALIETFPPKYLAVLVYHLPIPRPDPMMNPATAVRAGAYGISSTPSVIIDGVTNVPGGGGRGAAEAKFLQYRRAIESRLAEAPGVVLNVRANLSGDAVKVAYDFDRTVAGSEYLLVLAQDEQEHRGGNGVVFHKMVVRELTVIDPAAPRAASFDLVRSEKVADAYLTEFEKTYTRVPGFRWEVRRNAIARQGLKIVFFVQDKATGRVLNAAVADVK